MWQLVCDSDQHINEPRHLYEKWLPSKYKDQAPKVVEVPGVGDVWQVGNRHIPVGSGMTSNPGKGWPNISRDPVSYNWMRPGEYDPVEHLKVYGRRRNLLRSLLSRRWCRCGATRRWEGVLRCVRPSVEQFHDG